MIASKKQACRINEIPSKIDVFHEPHICHEIDVIDSHSLGYFQSVRKLVISVEDRRDKITTGILDS